MTWTSRNLLGLADADASEIRALLASADEAGQIPPDALKGRTIANLFFEDSTRTRISFSIAAQELGAHVVDLGKNSSVSKGESMIDTALTIEAMGVAALVVRMTQEGGVAQIAEHVGCSVINAGEGRSEHPTQALTDALNIARAFGRTDGFDLSGLRVGIVGDVVNSRVAGSNIACLSKLGAEVVLSGPASFAPASLASDVARVDNDFDNLVEACDVLMMLRIQFERHTDGSERDDVAYRAAYGLTTDRAARMKPGAVVMHPGPMNRGLEIDAEVADSDRSLVLKQVAGGVAVRRAVLNACVGAATLPA